MANPTDTYNAFMVLLSLVEKLEDDANVVEETIKFLKGFEVSEN